MNRPELSRLLTLVVSLFLLSPIASLALPAKKAPLMTKWASQVNRTMPWPEYPRPQFVRSTWLNLNGVWEYQSGTEGDSVPAGKKLSGEILVPFAVESALSGVMEHHDRLWYRRKFTVPSAWNGKQIILNFGAVDYEAQVFVNGKSVGIHTGGYVPFSYNITPLLKGGGPQELIVRVFDPTEGGGQPRGKQTTKPGGIMYTPTTGIWQTVWMEPVSRTAIQNLKIVPDIDHRRVRITVTAPAATPQTKVTIQIKALGSLIQTVEAKPNAEMSIPITKPKLWSPDHPFLYNINVTLAQGKTVTDRARSYFGMRKIAIAQQHGIKKMFLNNKFLFQIGPLDQGFWPDGIYTPPTEAALKADIRSMKSFGFNMVRKHIKVEPARWYYWTDKMGLLVWQDMPSPNSYIGNPPPIDKIAFEKQLGEVIQSHWNHPSIIMWVIFNESQARYDTRRLVSRAKKLDPSRLVDRDSGAGYEKGADGEAGDVDDVHSYPPPAAPGPSPAQALACGEYGGLGYIIKGHTWKSNGWGYATVPSARNLEDTYGEFTNMLRQFRDQKGLSAAVYTQLTDVEIESNGLMTYDRILKCNPKAISKANHFQYPVPSYRELVPTSEKVSQNWKYITTTPVGNWYAKNFDDASWQIDRGGFGTDVPGHGILGTAWATSDIWLRRSFHPGRLTALQISRLVIRDYHDENIEVYINGVPAYSAGGFISTYEYKPISKAAQQSIVPNADNEIAVHCHQTIGGQYIDVGLYERIPKQK